ncbi:MAG TPA: hypothetical protein VF796_05800 [Humisphaera sp.]
MLVGWSADWNDITRGRPVPTLTFTLAYVGIGGLMVWGGFQRSSFGSWGVAALWTFFIARILVLWARRLQGEREFPVALRLNRLGWSLLDESSEASPGRAVPWVVVSRVVVTTVRQDKAHVKFLNGKKVLTDVVVECPTAMTEDLVALVDRLRRQAATAPAVSR